MDIQAWIDRLDAEFYSWGSFNAYPVVPKPYIDVLKSVQGMTNPSTLHLINLAVQCMGPYECYLEVGTWRGATLIGALLGNRARGIAIDDDTMDEHDKDERKSWDVWTENVARFGMLPRVSPIDASVPGAFSHLTRHPPIGVYLFDGDKSTVEAAYAGIEGVLPFLANEALIFVDDANTTQIRQAVTQLTRAYSMHAALIMDLPTPGNCWPQWWNGLMAIAWQA